MRTMSKKEVNLSIMVSHSLDVLIQMQGIYLNLVFLGLQHTEVPDNALACFMDGSAKLKVSCIEQPLLCNTKKNV